MATYLLKAHDGNTYGPVDLDGLRVWIAEGRVAPQTLLQDVDTGESFSAGLVPGLFADPNLPPVVNLPPLNPAQSVTATDHMVPTRNPNALWSYYTGLFSLIPCFGLILGPVAIVLARKGQRDSESLPERIGRGHAITGLILGAIGSLISYGLVVLLFVGMASSGR